MPILLNTSFNENEPIVESYEDAINCYLRTNMDMLVLNNVVLARKKLNYILDKLSSNPRVTIITVCFNSEKTIKGTIESVLSQDYKNIEYIVVDADSSDETQNIIKQFEDKISLFICEKDNGIYDGMNKGIKNSTGEIIGILNSDDIYSSNKVISQVVSKLKITNASTLYADLVFVKKDNLNKVMRYWKSGQFSIKKLKKGWMLPHPTFLSEKRYMKDLVYIIMNSRNHRIMKWF